MIRVAISALWLVWIGLGCVADAGETATRMRLPSANTSAQAKMHGVRGPYLDATISFAGDQLRFFFSDNEVCRGLLESSEGLEYAVVGPYGQIRNQQASCDPIGLLSLAKWRDSRPRPRLASPVPRGRADYKIFHIDEELILARGRFSLAGLVGWPGGYDTVAVLANVPACEKIVGKGTATMEFHHSGEEALVLLNDKLRCPVVGFAQPVGSLGRR